MKKGKLIVFDGIDGSGKTTQIGLLKKYLDVQRVSWKAISFPQYGQNKFAIEIKKYLEGDYGPVNNVDPYEIAKLYASDRLLAKARIEKWLKEEKLVLVNRYVSANKAHMGANLDEDEREKFFAWIDHLEYELNGLPKADLTILLSVDPKVGQKNVQGGKHDIHEENLKHLEKASQIYLRLAKENANWYVVDCMKNGQMRDKEEIHQQIRKILENV